MQTDDMHEHAELVELRAIRLAFLAGLLILVACGLALPIALRGAPDIQPMVAIALLPLVLVLTYDVVVGRAMRVGFFWRRDRVRSTSNDTRMVGGTPWTLAMLLALALLAWWLDDDTAFARSLLGSLSLVSSCFGVLALIGGRRHRRYDRSDDLRWYPWSKSTAELRRLTAAAAERGDDPAKRWYAELVRLRSTRVAFFASQALVGVVGCLVCLARLDVEWGRAALGLPPLVMVVGYAVAVRRRRGRP